jgi:hypothetical protein
MKYVYITFVGFLGCGLLTISIYHFGGMKMIWFTIYFLSAIGGLALIIAAVGAIVDLIRRKEKRHG